MERVCMRGGLGAWEWMKKIRRPKVVPAIRASKTTRTRRPDRPVHRAVVSRDWTRRNGEMSMMRPHPASLPIHRRASGSFLIYDGERGGGGGGFVIFYF